MPHIWKWFSSYYESVQLLKQPFPLTFYIKKMYFKLGFTGEPDNGTLGQNVLCHVSGFYPFAFCLVPCILWILIKSVEEGAYMDFNIDRSEILHIKAYSCGSATLSIKNQLLLLLFSKKNLKSFHWRASKKSINRNRKIITRIDKQQVSLRRSVQQINFMLTEERGKHTLGMSGIK